MLELRGHGTLKATGKTLHGIAAVFIPRRTWAHSPK